MQQLANEMGLEESDFWGGTIRSLSDALRDAMLTINNASEAISGKATELLDASADDEAITSCPVVLPRQIAGKNHCTYSGWYHTDYSLPSEYFRADVERPSDMTMHQLDFTYLFSDDVDNPAHEAMGIGHRIRTELDDDAEYPMSKRNRMLPVEIEIENNPILKEALSQSRYWKHRNGNVQRYVQRSDVSRYLGQ